MIKIPEEILTAAELTEATGRKVQDIDIEITGLSVDRSSLVLSIDTKLNFVLPRNLESLMKERIRAKLGSVHKIRVNYMYSGIKVAPPSADNDQGSQSGGYSGGYNGSNGGGGGYRRKAKEEPAHENARGELILLGKDFTDVPVDYKDLENYVGAKDKVCIEGEVFSIESMPIRNGKILITILIAAKVRTFCIKAFISSEKFAEIDENLSSGDMIRARGPIEYDTYEHENLMMANALKKVAKTYKEDTYPNGRRVELHCHSKMSDNDGFNEVADIVNTAAYWGQPAVAITDHGVVQGFPDAAKAAGKLAKAGKNIKIIYGVEGYLYPDEDAWLEDGTLDIKKNRTYHIIILAKNQEGIKNIYKLVSLSHIDYFYKRPRLPRSVLQAHREGLIIGSACEAGEVYQAVEHGASDEELERIASFYDYLEIQPLGNNQFMVNEGRVNSVDDLIANNRKIIEIGDRLGKLTVATTDSHYPTQEASIYRNIIMAGIGFRDTPSDSLYLRTTDEMMKEFEYLGDRAEEIVVTNTNKIADMIDADILPVPKGKFPPKIEGAEEQLRTSCYEKAKSIYGDPLPPEIEERLETELSSIIGNGYAVMYIAAQMLVTKSNSD
ncbi:MAG: PHP domain-containing protein, partial [Mogibacterium sp.]|nr:PHP domain-containing protein [Mogibacterium sp.]